MFIYVQTAHITHSRTRPHNSSNPHAPTDTPTQTQTHTDTHTQKQTHMQTHNTHIEPACAQIANAQVVVTANVLRKSLRATVELRPFDLADEAIRDHVLLLLLHGDDDRHEHAITRHITRPREYAYQTKGTPGACRRSTRRFGSQTAQRAAHAPCSCRGGPQTCPQSHRK